MKIFKLIVCSVMFFLLGSKSFGQCKLSLVDLEKLTVIKDSEFDLFLSKKGYSVSFNNLAKCDASNDKDANFVAKNGLHDVDVQTTNKEMYVNILEQANKTYKSVKQTSVNSDYQTYYNFTKGQYQLSIWSAITSDKIQRYGFSLDKR